MWSFSVQLDRGVGLISYFQIQGAVDVQLFQLYFKNAVLSLVWLSAMTSKGLTD